MGKTLKDERWSLIVKIAYACMSTEYQDAIQDLLLKLAQEHNGLFQKFGHGALVQLPI